jgi:glutaredoxin
MNNNIYILLAAAVAAFYVFNPQSVKSVNQSGGSDSGFKNVQASSLVSKSGVWFLTSGKTGGLFAVTADWCGYCTKLKGAVKDSGISAFNFDSTDNSDPTVSSKLTEMGVNSFPTVFKIGISGELETYNGPMDSSGLKSNFN